MMPLLIASGLSVLRAPRLRLGPAIALVAGSVVFFGSHLLTVVWGSTILAVVAVALLACVPGVRRCVTRAGALRLAALVVPALLVSAWFLLPTAAYESHTAIADAYPHFRELLRQTAPAVAASNLFTFSRAPASGFIVPLSLPVLAVAWVLASIVLLARAQRSRRTWMRALLIIVGVTLVLGVLMTHVGLILALPRAYATLQFSFRLESFVLLGLSGAMVAVLAMARDGGPRLRRWTWLLAPIALVSVIGALEQADAHPQGESRSTALDSYLTPPPEKLGQIDYVDSRLAANEVTRPLPLTTFPLASVARTGHASVVVRVAPGALVATNLRGGPELVHVTGAKIVGFDGQLDDVLEVSPHAAAPQGTRTLQGTRMPQSPQAPGAGGSAATRISVGAAAGVPVLAGRAISLLALAFLVAELVWIAARGTRSRRGSRSRPRTRAGSSPSSARSSRCD